jgi:predicted membrane protein
MGDHEVIGLEKWLKDNTGMDIYFWNFIVLMFFTLFEIGAVFFDKIPGTDIKISLMMVWAILIVVGIIKGYGIGAYFMHLKGDPGIYFKTAMFPVLFVLLMIFGIGLSNPDGVDSLPSWCTPNWDYATRR